jgi:hypothetical protein
MALLRTAQIVHVPETPGANELLRDIVDDLLPVRVALPVSYAVGDLLHASSATALARLADVADGSVLRSGGVGAAPLWGKVRLSGATTDITGVLGTANGGTGGTLPVANGGTGDTGTAWNQFDPAATSAGGDFTSAADNGYYKKLGRTVFFKAEVFITTNGGASGAIQFTLPFQAANTLRQVVSGRNDSAAAAVGNIQANSTTVNVLLYDGTYAGGDGRTVTVSGVYESAA